MITYQQAIELRRLASMMATARVIHYRARHTLISTVSEEGALKRLNKAESDLLHGIDAFIDPHQLMHPDNVDAKAYWEGLLNLWGETA
jgi:hypothetical protein